MKEYETKSPEELRWGDYLGRFGRRMGWSFRIGGEDLQADHSLHRAREDEGAGLAGEEGPSGTADKGSHRAEEEEIEAEKKSSEK